MVTLTLTAEEAEQLHFILTSYLTDLRGEIRKTDVRTFRDQLQAREAFIRTLLQQLPTTAETTPP
jgi:LPS O-antigen subunit length determinant protein (WzzB/FepE family)